MHSDDDKLRYNTLIDAIIIELVIHMTMFRWCEMRNFTYVFTIGQVWFS